MKRLALLPILTLLLFLAFNLCSLVWGQEWDGQKIYRTYADSILFLKVTVELKSGGRQQWTGTGFIVHEDKGFVLTNAHVADNPPGKFKSFKIIGTIGGRGPDKPQFELQLIKQEPELDLALLRLPDRQRQWKTVQIGDSNNVVIGERVFVLGFPKDLDLSFVEGSLSNTNARKGRFQTSTPLNPGNSGGPAFNKRGDVIGVVVGGDKKGQNLNFLIPINFARGLLRLVGPLYK